MFFLELKRTKKIIGSHLSEFADLQFPIKTGDMVAYIEVHLVPVLLPTNLENSRFTTSDTIIYSNCWYLLLNGIHRGCHWDVAENITLDTLFSRSRGVPTIREWRMQLKIFWLSKINKGLSWV